MAKKSSAQKNQSAKNFVKKINDRQVNAQFSENALKMMRKRYLAIDEKGKQEMPADMFYRVAGALAKVEKRYGKKDGEVAKFRDEFYGVMASKEYTPAGRTMTNAGGQTPLIANCIVLPVLDTMEDIFQTLKEAALLQQAGSGLGFDFSHLRPAGSKTKRTNGMSSGPVEFLRIYDKAFGIIKQQGRHGANMAMMQIDHPDVLDFIRAKEREGDIRNFNISVKVTDEFMKMVDENPDAQWYCNWKGVKTKPRRVLRAPNGAVIGSEEVNITAKEIFDEIVNYAWLNGEPGIVFIDEVNRTNPLPGLGPIDCSNPCGEQFLHHYDNCNLGSINLAKFVSKGKVDWDRLKYVTQTAVRMMDNVIDLFDFPVKKVTDLAQKNRRIGLGIMGFADMLYQLGIGYNTEAGFKMGEKVMRAITAEAHKMSQKLAKEKGAFPNWDKSIFKKKGVKMRNAALTTVAPTGSISMMFDCSSGIEPNFALGYVKQDKDGEKYRYFNSHFEEALKAAKLSKEKIQQVKDEIIKSGSIQGVEWLPKELKKIFVVAMDISAIDHMKMQAAFQKSVDNSISKTINFPNSATKEDVAAGYIFAWKMRCKSATVYRDGSRTLQVLNVGTGENIASLTEDPNKLKAEKLSLAKREAGEVLNLPIDEGKIEPRIRPDIVDGKTYRVKTGYGNLYITINHDEYGAPFEVFASLGKSGGFFQEQSEGLCRLISIALRSGIKVEEIIKELKGIRGPMPVMTNRGTILSLPDAIAQILEEHVLTIAANGVGKVAVPAAKEAEVSLEAQAKPKSSMRKNTIADMGLMPGCPECGSALVLQEGCMSCKACGFSRCS